MASHEVAFMMIKSHLNSQMYYWDKALIVIALLAVAIER
jgi:hypothetical protein